MTYSCLSRFHELAFLSVRMHIQILQWLLIQYTGEFPHHIYTYRVDYTHMIVLWKSVRPFLKSCGPNGITLDEVYFFSQETVASFSNFKQMWHNLNTSYYLIW